MIKYDLGWRIQFYIILELCFWVGLGYVAVTIFSMPYWYISLWLGMIAVTKSIQNRWELRTYGNTFIKIMETSENNALETVKDK